MNVEITMSYNWDLSEVENYFSNIKRPTKKMEEVKEQLEEDARERIFEMIKQDYTSGELCSSVVLDENTDIQVYGYWYYGENKV